MLRRFVAALLSEYSDSGIPLQTWMANAKSKHQQGKRDTNHQYHGRLQSNLLALSPSLTFLIQIAYRSPLLFCKA
jgi:hypothetical protein